MDFLCVNLKDFHENQNGAETTTQIRFINSKNQEQAEKDISHMHPETAWFVLPKKYCGNKIVCRRV